MPATAAFARMAERDYAACYLRASISFAMLEAGFPCLQKILKDEDGSQLVHDFGPPVNGHLRFAKNAVGLDGGQALVPQQHRDVEVLAEDVDEFPDLLRLPSLGTTHAERQAGNDLHHLVLADDGFQRGQVRALISPSKSLHTLGGDAQRVRYG